MDATGRRLHPGARVHDSAGNIVGVVTRFSPKRGVEVVTDDNDVVAVHPSELHRADDPGSAELEGWFISEQDQHPVCLVVPIGGRDLQTIPGSPGPFPVRLSSTTQTPVSEWASECVSALQGLSDADAHDLIAAHLDAPMLRRLLDESTLPTVIQRMVPILTSQTPPHPGDTEPLQALLFKWLDATSQRRRRIINEVADPVVITSRPDVVEGMYHTLVVGLPPYWADCDTVAVAQAGGTPAMAFAATLAASRSGRTVNHVQVLKGGPVVEMSLTPTEITGTD